MSESSSTRSKVVAFIAILMLSAITMVWLFWRFPLTTAIITVALLAGLGISTRLARLHEVDISDMDSTEQRI